LFKHKTSARQKDDALTDALEQLLFAGFTCFD
jgi:hypothetical protein